MFVVGSSFYPCTPGVSNGWQCFLRS